MPNLTLKTEYIDELKQLGIYDKWFANLKKQWSDNNRRHLTTQVDNFADLIYYSFCWDDSIEGADFWSDIFNNQTPCSVPILKDYYTVQTDMAALYYTYPDKYTAKLIVNRKFLKITVGNSTWGFISRINGFVKGSWVEQGDLLMAAGKSPAKHARGNITSGTARFGVYGPSYLK